MLVFNTSFNGTLRLLFVFLTLLWAGCAAPRSEQNLSSTLLTSDSWMKVEGTALDGLKSTHPDVIQDDLYDESGTVFTFEDAGMSLFHRIDRFSSLGNRVFHMELPVADEFVRLSFEEHAVRNLGGSVRTFIGRSITPGVAYASLVASPGGSSANVLTSTGTIDFTEYIINGESYFTTERSATRQVPTYWEESTASQSIGQLKALRSTPNDGQADKILRIAVCASSSYTQYHGGKLATAYAMQKIIGHISNIFYVELGVHLELAAPLSQFIFDDPAADPFDREDISLILSQNQELLDNTLGDAHYDLGHVFTTTAGGKAVAGVGIPGLKAMGATGLPQPYGDRFAIDFVSHEIGHQLGANHIFNSLCGGAPSEYRNDSTSFEPGSGSTIMSYAGTCSQEDNLQEASDHYFNTISYSEMRNFLNQIDLTELPATNKNPTVSIATFEGVYIPIHTPFILTGKGEDDEPLKFCWEQIDFDPEHPLPLDQQSTLSPLFRSFPPRDSAVRYIPDFNKLLSGEPTEGELLPAYSRTLNFSLTARDYRGGVAYEDVSFHVSDQAGPFKMTYPDRYELFEPMGIYTLQWQVNGTNRPPVNCQYVRILLSSDGGKTFTILKERTPNDGSEAVVMPSLTTTRGRIMIQSHDNIFFTVSSNDFEIR